MKKIYIALVAVLLVLTGLMITYRIQNPPASAPTADYTRLKAELLLHNYRQDFADSGEEDQGAPDHSKIYGVMIELPPDGDSPDGASGFVFFDCFGICTHMRSDNSGYFTVKNDAELAETAAGVIAKTGAYYDGTFSRAKKSSYDVPRDNEIKIYVRAGDGVFYKTYVKEDAPQDLIEAYKSAVAAAEGRTE